jgi:uncharacterized protein YlzI (FlbEa/FlbD family)
MNDSLLMKYTGRTAESIAEPTSAPSETVTDDLGAFGWLRGTRDRVVMLELRKKNGNILAVGYGWIERVEFDPSVGITLHLSGHKITIKGRNLNAELRPNVRLFQGITRHRVPWIQEADEPASMQAGKNATVIDRIEW